MSPTAQQGSKNCGRRPTPMPGISGWRKSERSGPTRPWPAGRRHLSRRGATAGHRLDGVHDQVTFDTAGTLEPDQIYSTGVQIIPDTLPYAGQACNGQYNRNLESPAPGSAESGVGLIGAGPVRPTVQVRIDGGDRQQVAYGTTREDTLAACGDTNNGFGYTFNWNRLGNGAHNLRALRRQRGVRQCRFQCNHPGRGVPGRRQRRSDPPDFPQAGDNVTVRWAEPHQNFVIVGASRNAASVQLTAAARCRNSSLTWKARNRVPSKAASA